MARFAEFDHEHRRQIYDYVERHGAVEPERVRRNVLVQPPSKSKPARSGAELDPSVPIDADEFEHHVSILQRDGHLDERDGKLRVATPVGEDATTVAIGDAGDGSDDDDETLTATVRPARQEDISGIVGVVDTIANEGDYVVAARLADQVTREEVLFRQNESENRVFFVATVDDEAVGWLHVEAVQLPLMDHTAELTVGVLEAYRGEGLGSTLMERGLEWARDRGFRKIYQNLPATNEPAIDFLENAGWEIESTRSEHYHVDDEYVDEVQLAIWLDD